MTLRLLKHTCHLYLNAVDFAVSLHRLRMVSLSTHKFLHDIISSAQRYQDKGRPQTSAQLKVEGLVAALAAKGIVVNKIDYLYGE